ncbi:hypothetical protein chiPu_0025621, partial [Chiloscyllium punctatum]|nr:hypothetical protein [Chiloscyllium punctatum]
ADQDHVSGQAFEWIEPNVQHGHHLFGQHLAGVKACAESEEGSHFRKERTGNKT